MRGEGGGSLVTVLRSMSLKMGVADNEEKKYPRVIG
jgi:hypothetical protein